MGQNSTHCGLLSVNVVLQREGGRRVEARFLVAAC
jgi:hypothetical protein